MAVAPLGRIAVIVLALLRHDRRAADLADGNQIAQSTVRRRRNEVPRLPAAKVPRLDRALNRLVARGGQAVLIHERGRLIWISAARRGSTHDITAARHDHVLAHLRAAGLGALADLGFLGLDDAENPVVVTRYKATGKHEITRGQKSANTVLSGARAPVEHGFAHLKNWRILARLRTDPARATALLRALLVLTNLEADR